MPLQQQSLSSICSLISANKATANRRLWVAISGGLDSKVLLHWLVFQSAINFNLHLSLFAVHLRHHLEDDENLWEDDCKTYCKKLKVPLVVINASSPRHSSVGLEAAARHARLLAWQRLADTESAKHPPDYPNNTLWLAQGHHANDRAETLLHRIGRGTGTRGLAVLPAVSHFPTKSATLSIVRPILDWCKDDINSYADKHSIIGANDPANSDPLRKRTHLRQTILPAMLQVFPQFLHRAKIISDIATMELEVLDEVAEQTLKSLTIAPSLFPASLNAYINIATSATTLDSYQLSPLWRVSFLALSMPLQMLTFRHWWQSTLITFGAKTHHQNLSYLRLQHVLAMLAAKSEGGVTPLTSMPKFSLAWQKNWMVLQYNNSFALLAKTITCNSIYINICRDGQCNWHGGVLSWWWSSDKNRNGISEKLLLNNSNGSIVLMVRSRKASDVFRPSANRTLRSLRKWMSEIAIAQGLREILPVLQWTNKANASESLVAVLGVGVKAEWRAMANDKKLLCEFVHPIYGRCDFNGGDIPNPH